MRSTNLALVLLCCFSAPARPSEIPPEVLSTAAALRDAALAGTRSYDVVRSLTVEVGPRLAGSEGDRRAVAWAQRTLTEMGFDRVWTEPVTVPHWVRGEAEGEIVSPFPASVVLTALGGSVGAPGGGLEAPVVAFDHVDDLASVAPGSLAGKLVYFGRRMERSRQGLGYVETVGSRSRGPAEAARLGALGVLIRSVGTDSHRLAHTGGTRYAEGVPRIPAAALSNPDADLLEAQLASGREVRFRLRLTARELPDAESANVFAELRGAEAPEEIVLLACHLDSWDIGRGAVDDGAGCAIVVETLRRIAEHGRPRRTIRVGLFANEELGLSGAKAYAESHAEELPMHRMASESDLGPGPVFRFSTRVQGGDLSAMEQIQELLAPLGIERGDNEAFGGADVSPIRKLGVPVVSLQPDAERYFDLHHTPDDTLDKIDPRDLDQSVAAWLALTWSIADSGIELATRPPEPEDAH